MVRAIVLSIDDKYLLPAEVFIYSLYVTSSLPAGQPIIVLYEQGLSPHSIAKLDSQITSYRWNPIFLEASHQVPDILPLSRSAHVSRAAFYRLFAANLLGKEFDSALYLDVDMVAIASIDQLMNTPITKPVAAVDHFSHQDGLRLWGEAGGSYFQSGVLLIDLEWWRSEDIEREFKLILDTKSNLLRWWDQDVLNLAFKDQWQRLPWSYNVGLDCTRQLSARDIQENARIIHYDGTSKPWTTWSRRPYKSYWYHNYRGLYGKTFNVSSTKRSLPLEALSLIKHSLNAAMHDLARSNT